MNTKILKLITLFFLLIIGLTILIANYGLIYSTFPFMTKIPYYDKIGHFFLMGMTAFLVNMSLICKKIKIGPTYILKGSLIVFIIISIEEFSQIFIKFRTFSFWDLSFDYLGIYLFGKLASYLNTNYVKITPVSQTENK